MRWILAAFPMAILASQAFGINLDFGNRLSAKNILLYSALLVIISRMVKTRRLQFELPGIQLWFVALIAYAVVSWGVASFVIKYPNYPVLENGVFLKLLLVDYFLIYLVFFYGPRTQEETLWIMRMLLGVVLCVQLVTVGESMGLLTSSFVPEQRSGRVDGLIGEANQSAAFAAFFMPPLLAMAVSSRGLFRFVWIGAAVLSAVAFLMMASRGATVGLLVAILAGAVLLRRELTFETVVRWAGVVTVILAIGVLIASYRYGDLIYQRFVTHTFGGTVDDASMGRTMIWLQAIDKMVEQPITFLTGFGWRAYWSLPNVLSPHNTYLNLWFNLGLLGVTSYLAIFGLGLRGSLQAGAASEGPAKAMLMACTFSIICAAVTLFFLEWYQPWPYFWAYFGLCMRLVVFEQDRLTAGKRVLVESSTHRLDGEKSKRRPFGWSVNSR